MDWLTPSAQFAGRTRSRYASLRPSIRRAIQGVGRCGWANRRGRVWPSFVAEEKEAAAPTELLRPGRHAPRVLPRRGPHPSPCRGFAAGTVGCGRVKYRHEHDYRHIGSGRRWDVAPAAACGVAPRKNRSHGHAEGGQRDILGGAAGHAGNAAAATGGDDELREPMGTTGALSRGVFSFRFHRKRSTCGPWGPSR